MRVEDDDDLGELTRAEEEDDYDASSFKDNNDGLPSDAQLGSDGTVQDTQDEELRAYGQASSSSVGDMIHHPLGCQPSLPDINTARTITLAAKTTLRGSRTPGPPTPARDAASEAFTDADVRTTRQYAVAMSAARGTPTIRVEPLTNLDLDSTGAGVSQRATPRQRRRASADVPKEHSRSSTNIPDILKPVFHSKVIPTILDYFGAKQDPWGISEGGRHGTELLELCQEVINEVCPRFPIELTKADVTYKVIRQHIYEWRSNFANAAVIAIEEAITAKFGSRPSRSAANSWVKAATEAGGEAFWAQAHRDPAKARGKMQSAYILKSFATHLTATAGSVRDFGYPGGALALAATAVQHCFPMFSRGSFEPGKAFTAVNVGALTDSWYHKVHRAFVEKPEKFDALIRSAARHTVTARPHRNRVGIVEAPDVFDRSSPPIEDELSEMV
ncbi:hypothetical protein FKP32DRAFT_1599331 [Trametes sanguinea]|nr:hypothetical protein FKP32DRAFT_1599331 [Trametes sanguinea]